MTTNLSANAPTDTPIPTGGETTAVPITVTILDAATIFEAVSYTHLTLPTIYSV